MPAVYRFHGFALDTAAGLLTGPHGPVPLRPKALALLEVLARAAGRALGKDEIMHSVWPGVTVTDETLTQTVHELRRALEDDVQALIRTVPRRGYLFPSEALDTAPARHRTLAVSPFENLSSDPEQAFFAAGLRLDLESALGLIGGIELRPDHDNGADVRLTGSVRASDGNIRVTARLIESAGARQLWSGRFDGRADGIFALQDEITRKVAVAMQVELTTGDYARLWDGQTSSLAAWERYVIAYGHYLRWTEADISRARDLLREALSLDPGYVGAKVMLAKTWWYDARFHTEGDAREHAIDEAERLSREVLAERPDAGNALMTLGGAAWLRDRHDEAVALCRRACDMSPSDAWVLGFYGMIAIFSGDLPDAMIVLDRAARLSPQTIAWVNYHIGHARAWTGDDAGAVASLRTYIASAPHDPWGQAMLAVAHGFANRPEDARRAISEALREEPGLNLTQARRAHRFRDPARLERMLRVLAEAGLPA
jgi:DNA-binding winged helix-turn-helix (wHTH) protein/tetratricopeptide (TPR) repeat protein